jgi:curved DNA-binding protein
LSDAENRKKYDKYGKDWKHGEEFEKARQSQSRQYQNAGGHSFEGGGFGDDDFSEFFSSMFGNQGRSRQQTKFRGQDFNAELHLTLEGAFTTHKQTLAVNGKNIRITIPAGVEDGQVIKLTGHGGPGVNGGPHGDLYITFVIEPHPTLKRVGNDLYTNAEIDIYTAILGGEHTIDTLSGKIKLKVTPETQNGTKIRLKGKGFPVYKNEGQYGDLYVTYLIKIPTNLTEKQKELFRELSKL